MFLRKSESFFFLFYKKYMNMILIRALGSGDDFVGLDDRHLDHWLPRNPMAHPRIGQSSFCRFFVAIVRKFRDGVTIAQIAVIDFRY